MEFGFEYCVGTLISFLLKKVDMQSKKKVYGSPISNAARMWPVQNWVRQTQNLPEMSGDVN